MPFSDDTFRPCLWPDILEIFGCSNWDPIAGCQGEECPSELWEAIANL